MIGQIRDWKDEIFNKVANNPDKIMSYEMIYEALNLAEKHFLEEECKLNEGWEKEITRLKAEIKELKKHGNGTR